MRKRSSCILNLTPRVLRTRPKKSTGVKFMMMKGDSTRVVFSSKKYKLPKAGSKAISGLHFFITKGLLLLFNSKTQTTTHQIIRKYLLGNCFPKWKCIINRSKVGKLNGWIALRETKKWVASLSLKWVQPTWIRYWSRNYYFKFFFRNPPS